VSRVGRLHGSGEGCDPYRLVDGDGVVIEAVAEYFRDLQAAGRSASTLRSCGLDLLRWFRFLWAIGVPWSRASRIEARDFCRWMLIAGKPSRPHWRRRGEPVEQPSAVKVYAPSVRAHCETVLRCFYEFCAMRRSVISPVQRGEMGGISLDPMAYPAPKGNTGTIAC
jgi:hypothetical protein